MRNLPIIMRSLPALIAVLMLGSCGGSNNDKNAAAATPEFQPDTSYLDQLAEDAGVATAEPETEQQAQKPAETDQTQVSAPEQTEEEKAYADEKRTWVPEEGSKSIFGKSRDRAIGIGEKMQDSTQPANGLANTTYDEEYAQAAGYAWDMPVDWRMAVPTTGHFAEMFISNPYGNASVVFSKETASIADIRRDLESYITSTFGDSKAQTSPKEIKGFKVTVFDLEGSYIDPLSKGSRNESPFYAIHAAIIELPTTKVLIKLWGPQDTVHQSAAEFDRMLEKMYEKEP